MLQVRMESDGVIVKPWYCHTANAASLAKPS